MISWLISAAEGLQDFVDHELFSAIKEKDADWRGFGMSLAGNLLWAMACFNPVGAAAMLAFILSVEGIAIAAMGSLPSSSKAEGADPAEITKSALRGAVINIQLRLYDSIRGWAEEESRAPNPTFDQVVEGTLLRLFDVKYLLARGDSRRLIEINQTAVTAEFKRQATGVLAPALHRGPSGQYLMAEFKRQATGVLARYKDQVQPIGTTEGYLFSGARTYVPLLIKDEPSDLRHVLALRRVEDNRYKYEFVRWIDEDLATGAAERASGMEETVTVAERRAIENLPPAIRPLEGASLPSSWKRPAVHR